MKYCSSMDNFLSLDEREEAPCPKPRSYVAEIRQRGLLAGAVVENEEVAPHNATGNRSRTI
jgi:hypothetical protein